MIEDLVRAYDLLYHHVSVLTTVRQTKDCSINYTTISDEPGEFLEFTGYLKVVDPISKSVILCQVEEGTIVNNVLILGHVINTIQISTKPDSIPVSVVSGIIQKDSLTKLKAHPYSKGEAANSLVKSETIDKREEAIIKWLKKNRIPAKYDGVNSCILIADCVKLKPTYQFLSDYICPNRIVLKRLKHIVDSRPQESLDVEYAKER